MKVLNVLIIIMLFISCNNKGQEKRSSFYFWYEKYES